MENVLVRRAHSRIDQATLGSEMRLGITRAVKDQSAPIPEETTSELGRISYIVRRALSRIDQATL